MAKMRSPNYPAIGLDEAIRAVEAIWDKEKRTPVPMDMVGTALGYRSISGPVRTKVAALRKYGLLEQSGGNYRVSDLAMQILHGEPHSDERSNALVVAATRPEIFQELRDTHLHASDEALKSHLLVRKGFSEAGAKQLIKAFRETMAVANGTGSGYTPPDSKETIEDQFMEQSNRTLQQEERGNKMLRVNIGTSAEIGGSQLQPTIQNYSFALSMPRNVRAELRLVGKVTKSDVERLRKQIEFLEEQFEDEPSQP